MIYYLISFAFVAAMAFMWFCIYRDEKRLEHLEHQLYELNDMMNDTREDSASVHALRALYAELEDVKKDIAELQGEGLDKVLEKKWEDAIQRISDFDPFGEDSK